VISLVTRTGLATRTSLVTKTGHVVKKGHKVLVDLVKGITGHGGRVSKAEGVIPEAGAVIVTTTRTDNEGLQSGERAIGQPSTLRVLIGPHRMTGHEIEMIGAEIAETGTEATETVVLNQVKADGTAIETTGTATETVETATETVEAVTETIGTVKGVAATKRAAGEVEIEIGEVKIEIEEEIETEIPDQIGHGSQEIELKEDKTMEQFEQKTRRVR
jgi:hypothetical protein